MVTFNDFRVWGRYFAAPIRKGWDSFIDLLTDSTGESVKAPYLWSTSTSLADPGAGYVKVDNGDPSLAVLIMASATNSDGTSADLLLGIVTEGDYMSIPAQAAVDNLVYQATGPSVDMGGWYQIPVVNVSVDGAHTNNEAVFLTWLLYEDHTKYLLRDGTTDLTGDWDTGGDYGVENLHHIDFDLTAAGVIHEPGRIHWDDVSKTLSMGLSGVNVELQAGQEITFPCHNDSGVDIFNGEAVYQTGSLGTLPTIAHAIANAKPATFLLGLATEDILDGNNGYVTDLGYVRDIDTSNIIEGQFAFLSATIPGAFQDTPPNAPNYKARIGTCIVQDAINGIMKVDHGVVPFLRNLSDVETQPPAPNDCPVWSSDNQWFDMTNIGGFFNGTFIESFDAVVTSDGATITMSLEQAGGGDLTMKFSGGEYDLDCTPPQTITLTPGTDAIPQANYVYIPESTMVLTLSTTQWPDAEHVKVGYFLVPSAAYVAVDGAYINQNWNDHREGTDGQGHLAHVCEAIRLTMRGAAWHSGVDPNATGAQYLEITGTAPSVVDFKSSSGVCYQMHKHDIPAIDMSAGTDAHVTNWLGDSYHAVADIAEILLDANGNSLQSKYFNLVFWAVANKTGEYAPLMVNLPTGSYNSEASAVADVSGYDVMTIPYEFTADSCTGFLICRLTVRFTPGGTWAVYNTVDLRGVIPSATASGGGGGSAITNFADNLFTIYNVTDSTKIVDFDVSGLTTATTRTFTFPDASGIIALTTDLNAYLPLTGGVITGNLGLQGYNTVQGPIEMATGTPILMTYGGPIVWLKDNGMKVNASDQLELGTVNKGINLAGSGVRPHYNGSDLALWSDIGSALTGYLPLAGGEMFGPLVLGNQVQFQGEATSGTAYHLMSVSAANKIIVGDTGIPLEFHGSLTNPKYNSSDLALISDIPAFSTTFIGLTDTPASYAGAASYVVGVNAGGTGLEFTGDRKIVGTLFLDNTTNPEIQLREGASTTDYSRFLDTGKDTYLIKYTATDKARIFIEPRIANGTNDAEINFFRSTNTTGDIFFNIYAGDGSATVRHSFDALTGDVHLCNGDGNLYIDTPYVWMSSGLRITDGGSANGTFIINSLHTSVGYTALIEEQVSGAAYIGFEPRAKDGTSAHYVRMFREFATTGGKSFLIHKGDGTSGISFTFDAKNERLSIGNTVGDEKLNVLSGAQLMSNGWAIKWWNAAGTNKRTCLYLDGSGIFQVGNPSEASINLRGGATRPTYNSAALALLTDVPGAVTAPRTVSMTVDNSAQIYQGSYVTIHEETSGGPWIVHALELYSINGANTTATFKVTVDGTLIYTSTNKAYFQGDVIIGAGSVLDMFGVLYCRTSFKLEVQCNSSSTDPIRFYTSYQGVSIT